MNSSILIVEDDQNTSRLIQTYLEREGYTTLVVNDGYVAMEKARSEELCFILLDIMLPGLDGWEICRRIRKFSDVPILMLTAREEEIDRVMGLSIGADDYVVKPFSPRELVERVKAILRRTQPQQQKLQKQQTEEVYCHGQLSLNHTKHKVLLTNQEISLTTSEYKLLLTLMRAPGRVFTRDDLLQRFYEHDEVVIERVIDVHIGNLRQKIESDPSKPIFIETVRGFGYRFTDKKG